MDAEHVLLEMRQLRERLLAQLAGVRLLPGVHPQVKLECGRVREGPLADLARVWPLARVHSHVHCQLRPLVEARAALRAREWLALPARLVGVRAHVITDVTLPTNRKALSFMKMSGNY